ncbi:MAG: sensor domain-containing diguanylate cyclase [Bryobacteraceae bacterium]
MPLVLDEQTCRDILESLAVGLYVTDPERRIVLWNDGAERITGYKRQEVLGRLCPDQILEHYGAGNNLLCGDSCLLTAAMRDGQPREATVFLCHKEGERIPVRVRAVPVRNERGTIVGVAECFDEVAAPQPDELLETEPVEDRFDLTTGIPDRKSMELHLRSTLEHFRASQVPFAAFAVSMDGLDRIRETRGQKAAEAVLRVAARTLMKNLRPSDAVGRWSRDRLLAIASNCPSAALASVAGRLKKIVDASSVPWWGDRIPITISMAGASILAGETGEKVVARAEAALVELTKWAA